MSQSEAPKHEILARLSERYGCPTVEYHEGLTVPQILLLRLDVDTLKSELWMPLSLDGNRAEVIACDPEDPELNRHIRETLGVDRVDFRTATRPDLIRLLENSWDLNADFPATAGRTSLAKVRTYLAAVRTRYADQRTQFARSRTGLALTRTGLACVGIAVAFLRLFGGGDLLVMEIPLLAFGIAATVDGLFWYLPARREHKDIKPYPPYDVPEEFSVLEVSDPGGAMNFARSPVVESAAALRQHWDALSPVERRRFLANDRTDLAEERTVMAYLRTMMAKARTGLAFARTGIAFGGIGIGFIRKFHTGPWSPFDWALIAIGVVMLLEGFYWYLPGRKAANAGREAINKATGKKGPWDRIFPSLCLYTALKQDQAAEAASPQAEPGVWATTGLALERTALADKRNGMSRLRTVMARSRTGMAFIRTGFSIMSVGGALLVYFGGADLLWTAFELLLIAIGVYLIGDGLYWFLPAERVKRRSPFCNGDFEIAYPDYSEPIASWDKVSFSHDN
ncbi:MAG: hypothetical protein P8076_12080 [Gammaproteobacteria bacterium]